MAKFTKRDIENWGKFERLRIKGTINMFDVTSGCLLTGLNEREYMFCMNNYEDLKFEVFCNDNYKDLKFELEDYLSLWKFM